MSILPNTFVSSRRAQATAALSVLAAVALAASSALAQSDPKRKTPGVKKRANPFLDRKSLTIPGKLPKMKQVKSGDAKKLRPELKKALERKTKKPTSKRPPPPPPRKLPPSKDTGPGFADLKKASGKRCKPMRPNEKVTFDFKGEIKELVESISKTTCKNFIITNKVRSQKFEIISPTPITVDEAWRAFLSALEANDLSIIRVGRYYKIIPANEGINNPVPVYGKDENVPIYDRMVTKIWKLKHGGDINAVANYLNVFKTKKGQLHTFAGTQTIIVTDFGTSIKRLERIFQEIDQPGGVEQVHIIPVEYASASEIAAKLSEIFEPQKSTGRASKGKSAARLKIQSKTAKGKVGEDDDAAVKVSKILSDDRTNKLIIISSKRALSKIKTLMRELDIPEDGTDGQIHVLRLKHADAEELSSTLSSLAQGKPTTTRRTTSKSKAKPKAATGAALFQGEVKVTADKATNSLVITASKSDLSSIKRVIEKLDVPRFQVFVEASILEVSINRDRDVGVGWHGGVAPTIDGQTTPILFGSTPIAELSSLSAALNPLGLVSLSGLAGAIRGPTLDGTEEIVTGGIPGIGLVVQALARNNNVNVVSSPHLLTMDNEEAQIEVNEKRPFSSGISLGGGLGALGALAGQAGGGAAGALGNLGGLGLGQVGITREDVGLTLKIKPQINDEDYVRLEIDQELSDIAGQDTITGQQVTSKRAAKTSVVVRSQDSVVIGGLVRDRETTSESKVPLLGDIPILGWLFKRQNKVVEKVNLILVLTPYIIRGPEDFRKIFERKMAERKEFANRFFGDLPDEYRAAIDWNRKKGPLASYRSDIKKELEKAENEGPGDEGDTIIRQEDQSMDSMDGDGAEDLELPSGDPAEDATPDVPDPLPEQPDL